MIKLLNQQQFNHLHHHHRVMM